MLLEQILLQLQKDCPERFDSPIIFRGELRLFAKNENLIELCRYLRDDVNLNFNFLSMITAADYLDKRDKRFEVIYSLYSISEHHRIMIKLKIGENEQAPSLTSLWDTANWQEREVYDMFGIKFAGHPDLRRVLMDDDWVGHPQRKDFPLTYEMPEFSHNRGQTQLRDFSPDREVF